MSEMARPAVSVIVPVHNVAAVLEPCLDSLLKQTLRDLEILVVDDGSTDESGRIADAYAARYPDRLRVLHKTNGGLGDARNHGIAHARGEYLAFVDGDDLVAPAMLETMLTRARESGAELVVCGIRNIIGAELGPYYPEPDMSVFGRSLAQEPRLMYRVDASACDKLYARDLFERTGVRFPVGMAFEDVPTVYRLLPHANRVEKIDEPLYLYRRERVGSITGVQGARYLDLVAGFRILDRALAQDGFFEANREGLLRLHLTHLIAGRYPDFFAAASASDRSAFARSTYELLDARFPGWRHDAVCRELWPNMALRALSTHRRLLLAFARMPRRVYLGFLARTGAFDPLR